MRIIDNYQCPRMFEDAASSRTAAIGPSGVWLALDQLAMRKLINVFDKFEHAYSLLTILILYFWYLVRRSFVCTMLICWYLYSDKILIWRVERTGGGRGPLRCGRACGPAERAGPDSAQSCFFGPGKWGGRGTSGGDSLQNDPSLDRVVKDLHWPAQ